MNLFHKTWFWFVAVIAIIVGVFLFVWIYTGSDFGLSKKTQDSEPVIVDYLAVPRKIVVAFKKGVSQLEAENLLKKYNLEFLRTGDVNHGKIFSNESGEKFIVNVPANQEQIWIDKFNELPQIYKANWYITPEKTVVD